MAQPLIRTLDGDLSTESVGFTLSHEHVYCDFARLSGDPDLELTDEAAITADLVDARCAGVDLLVEVSTYDMGAEPGRVAKLCRVAGLQVVKSTGWFRSPSLDHVVTGMDARALMARLVADLRDGFAGSNFRAGVIGEVGMSGTTPTQAEQTALSAVGAAAAATGAGVIAHTDDWANADALISQLIRYGLSRDRIMMSHARCSDPIAGQQDLIDSGVTLGFDQLGHPGRDSIAAVADRIEELVARGCGSRLTVSADVGRRSRLQSAGGSGYVTGVCQLLAALRLRGLGQDARDGLTRTAPARFLAFIDRGGT